MLQQTTLQSGTARTTGVVDHPRLLRAGATLVLRDSAEPTRRWTVATSYALPHAVPRGWHNDI